MMQFDTGSARPSIELTLVVRPFRTEWFIESSDDINVTSQNRRKKRRKKSHLPFKESEILELCVG